MVNDVGIGLFLHGVILGRLRIPHQFDPVACDRPHADRPLFASNLRRIQHTVLRGHHSIDANFVRWLSTGSELRTYAGEFWIEIILPAISQ